jgi:hypothetical protein
MQSEISFTVPSYIHKAWDSAPATAHDALTAQVIELLETTLGVTKPVTLRSLGMISCEHPLLVGNSPTFHDLCPFCGARKTPDGGMSSGSLDYEMQPVFANEAKRALKRMEAAEAAHGQ